MFSDVSTLSRDVRLSLCIVTQYASVTGTCSPRNNGACESRLGVLDDGVLRYNWALEPLSTSTTSRLTVTFKEIQERGGIS